MKKAGSSCLSFSLFFAVFSLSVTVHAQKDSASRRKLLLLPVIAKSIETGWSFGAAGSLTFRLSPSDTLSRTSNLQLLALYSTKKQLITALNGSQYFHREKYVLNEQFSFSSYPDKFWGLGKNTPDSVVEPYKFNQYYVYLHLLRKIGPGFFAGLLFETQRVWDVEYRAGGLFDQQNVLGRTGYRVAGLGGSLTYDKRTNAFSPDNGVFFQFSFNHFDKFWGSDYNYTNYVLDLRKYIPIAHTSQVLAFQFYSFNNAGEVPIRSLAAFGGASRMRGYYEGRYKDLNQLVVQGEYRFPVYKRFGGVVFGGGGNVSRSMTNYALDDLKFSYGAGLRFALDKKEKLNLRVDFGMGQQGNSGFYLQLGEAF